MAGNDPTPFAPPNSLLQIKFQFGVLTIIRPFLVSARKGPKEAEQRGAKNQCAPFANPRPIAGDAFKNRTLQTETFVYPLTNAPREILKRVYVIAGAIT